MGFEYFSKLAAASDSAYKSLSKKWEERKSRHIIDELKAEEAEVIRLRNEYLGLVAAKITGESIEEMAPLEYNGETDHKAVFLVTIPISFGEFELSERTYELLARHVGMSLDSVSHWAVCVIDRGLGACYCYDLMSDRMELNVLGKNYFRVAEIGPEYIETWSSCYYVGETTKSHSEIQELGNRFVSLNPRYRLLSNNCQHLVESMVKELCNGKVISQAKLEEELAMASPKIARDLMVSRIRSKLEIKGENEDSETVQEDVDVVKTLWAKIKHT